VSDIGMIPVDWEVRFDPQRMLRERLQRAKDALNNSDLDALFVFRTEDARYLTGYRHHLGPAFIMGNAVTVLSRNHDPILWTMDFEHCKLRMPWLSPDQIRPRANFREKIGMKRWAEQVEGLVGSLAGKRVGIKHIPGPLGVRGRNSDNRLIREKLGWEPSAPLRDGLAKAYAWIAQQVADAKRS